MGINGNERRKAEIIGSNLPSFLPPVMGNYLRGILMGQVAPLNTDHVRYEMSKYFEFAALTPLTPEMEELLKADIWECYVFLFKNKFHEVAGNSVYIDPTLHNKATVDTILSSEEFGIVTGTKATHLHERDGFPYLSPAQKTTLFTFPPFYTNARISRDRGTEPLLGNGTRHLYFTDASDPYNRHNSYGFTRSSFKEAMQMVRQAQNKRGSDLLLGLDIGGSNGLAANDAETLDPNLAMTNLTFSAEMAMWPLRGQHVFGMAERMTAEWRNRYDIIVSNMAFRYFRYPDIALINAFEALQTGGVMHISFGTDRCKLHEEGKSYELNQRLSALFARMRQLERQGLIEFLPTPDGHRDTHDLLDQTEDYRSGLVWLQKKADFTFG